MAFSKHIPTRLFDQVASGIIICYGDQVEYVNQACHRWFQPVPAWPSECRVFFEKMPAPLREAMETALQRERYETTLCLPSSDEGSQLAVRIASSRIEGGDAATCLIMLTDETQALQNQQLLQQAMSMAEAASKAKTDFLATMSHEIRTPLNSIIGFTSLLLDTEMPAGTRGYLDAIYKSGESLLLLVNDMLDLSRLSSGEVPLSPTMFNLPGFFSEIERETRLKTLEKNLAWHVHLKDDLPVHILMDEGRLYQVINNLISNSIKFTQQGSISLTVAFAPTSDSSGCLEIEVRDTGIGIPEEHHDQIFDVFNQVNNQSNRPFEGIGLGLSITRRLVTLMKGTISINSQPGSGSVFTMRLPCTIVENVQENESDGATISLVTEDNHGLTSEADDDHIGLPAEWLPDVHRVRKLFIYNDVEDLCRKIDEFDAPGHHRALSGIAANLRNAANEFNLEEADTILQRLEQLIQKPTI